MGPTIRTRTPCPTRAVAHAAGRVARGPEVDGSPNSEIEPRIPGRLVGDLLLTAIVTKPSGAVSHQWADSFAATMPPYLRLDVYDEWFIAGGHMEAKSDGWRRVGVCGGGHLFTACVAAESLRNWASIRKGDRETGGECRCKGRTPRGARRACRMLAGQSMRAD